MCKYEYMHIFNYYDVVVAISEHVNFTFWLYYYTRMNAVTWITEPDCFSNSLLYPLLFHNSNSTFHNSQLCCSTEERICSHLNEPTEVRPCERFVRQPSERAAPQHPISVFRGGTWTSSTVRPGVGWVIWGVRPWSAALLLLTILIPHRCSGSRNSCLTLRTHTKTLAAPNSGGTLHKSPIHNVIYKHNAGNPKTPHPTYNENILLSKAVNTKTHNTFKQTLRHITNTLTVEQPHIGIHLCVSLKYLHLLFI